jgi:hypothetical protein
LRGIIGLRGRQAVAISRTAVARWRLRVSSSWAILRHVPRGLGSSPTWNFNVGGRERTTDEYAALLARSGLRFTKTIPLGTTPEAMEHQLIEAQLA